MAADDKVMAAEVEAKAGNFQLGAVKPVFTAAFYQISGAPFDVSGDGKRFVIVSVVQGQGSPITLVVNWPAKIGQ